ncbi:MAG: hypothetical protein JWN73_3602 [Betaproteobacteria bacterium]|nr:hypothetical protein [Betaproteobacteria bacterium]
MTWHWPDLLLLAGLCANLVWPWFRPSTRPTHAQLLRRTPAEQLWRDRLRSAGPVLLLLVGAPLWVLLMLLPYRPDAFTWGVLGFGLLAMMVAGALLRNLAISTAWFDRLPLSLRVSLTVVAGVLVVMAIARYCDAVLAYFPLRMARW